MTVDMVPIDRPPPHTLVVVSATQHRRLSSVRLDGDDWAISKDGATGKAFVHRASTGESQWLEDGARVWRVYSDAATGKKYRQDAESGKTEWLDGDGNGDGEAAAATAVATAAGEGAKEEADKDGPETEAEWEAHVDVETGSAFWHHRATGRSSWVEPEAGVSEVKKEEAGKQEPEQGHPDTAKRAESVELPSTDDLYRRIRAKLIGGGLQGSTGDPPSFGQLRRSERDVSGLISETRGDWLELVIPVEWGGEWGQVAGHTIYFNRRTAEVRWDKPPGWVLLQVSAIQGEKG
eukprot:g4749.t1